MDIRKRLQLGDKMPDELAQRKAKVLQTLKDLQREVEPITGATELLKDSENMDSKKFLSQLKKDFDVSILFSFWSLFDEKCIE